MYCYKNNNRTKTRNHNTQLMLFFYYMLISFMVAPGAFVNSTIVALNVINVCFKDLHHKIQMV